MFLQICHLFCLLIPSEVYENCYLTLLSFYLFFLGRVIILSIYTCIKSLYLFDFDQDDETDYHDSRRSRRRFEEELEAEVRAEKRIINAKKVLLLELFSKFPINFLQEKVFSADPFSFVLSATGTQRHSSQVINLTCG